MASARADGASGDARRPGLALSLVLAYLTFLSGFLDALSYLGLGRIFTANMTGNVAVLGFALGGAEGFSITASAVSIAAFLVGAGLGGRFVRSLGTPTRWLVAALVTEAAGAALAGALAQGLGLRPGDDAVRYGVIAVLAVALGCRNAAVRKLGVPDVTTTVLTGTLTGIAADSALAGGANDRYVRRVGSVALMLGGALVGAEALRAAAPGAWFLAAAGADVLVVAAFAHGVRAELVRGRAEA